MLPNIRLLGLFSRRSQSARQKGEIQMTIVTDSGCDLSLHPDIISKLDIQVVPLSVTLKDETFEEGPTLDADGFYQKLESGDDLPTTSQPSAGAFAELYRRIAKVNPSILSIHISSGLSGTLQAARAGAAQVPEANVTFFDTKNLSIGAGWQVEAAAHAIRAGWPLDRVLDMLARLRASSETIFTLKELKYLIHGGRISHMKGLIASILNIKPIIGVEKEGGTYAQYGQARSFSGAIKGLAEILATKVPNLEPMRVQVVHALHLEGTAELQKEISEKISCVWQPISRLSLVLGAHTGPTLIGACVAPASIFEEVGMPAVSLR
jgi:DegV family protein with EDD domain